MYVNAHVPSWKLYTVIVLYFATIEHLIELNSFRRVINSEFPTLTVGHKKRAPRKCVVGNEEQSSSSFYFV